MINLLNASEKRRLQFVQILANTDDWMTLKELSQILNCSTRVLHTDIAFFRDHFVPTDVQTSTKGIRVQFTKGHNIKSLYQIFLRESAAYTLLELVFLHEGIAIGELAERLSVSVPSIYRMIDLINEEKKT